MPSSPSVGTASCWYCSRDRCRRTRAGAASETTSSSHVSQSVRVGLTGSLLPMSRNRPSRNPRRILHQHPPKAGEELGRSTSADRAGDQCCQMRWATSGVRNCSA